MADVKITNLFKRYGAVEVLRDIDLDIKSGEFITFVGPSGCGKSTLLRCISGLEEISDGTLEIDGADVTDIGPSKRGIAMVFQSYALYPHMTVYDNMAYSLKLQKMPKPDIESRVMAAAEKLQLVPYLKRHPRALSGGQRQRVAIGRAIVRDPKVFLFDEPLSNLDAALRVATRVEIAQLKQRMPDTTMIYVTHDQVEAMTLADRIVVMNGGRIEQVGSPLELYHRPANRFVAGFIGSPAMNFVTAEIQPGASTMQLPGGDALPVPFPLPAGEGVSITVGVRPENLTLAKGGAALLRGKVTVAENLGELITAYLDIGRLDPVIVKLPGDADIEIGQELALSAEPARIHVFDKVGQRIPSPHDGV